MRFKEFGKAKRYDSRPELLDVHVERLKEAHRLAKTHLRDSELLDSGLIVHPGFFENKEEIALEISSSVVKDGKDESSRIVNLPGTACYRAMAVLWPMVSRLFQDRAQEEVANLFAGYTYRQHLLNLPDDKDEQKVFHTDTFFPCVKFWYFPRAVEDGAFCYVPYSVKLTDKMIAWHEERVRDLKSGACEEWRGPGHKEGSFRISLEEIDSLGLSPVTVKVPENTLVIANVFGFHRRGDTKKPTHRLSIHGSIRIRNPFAYA